MEKRTLTIEEMIAAGASWNEITSRVRDLLREKAEKERAEKMAQAEKAKKAEIAAAARERFVVAFVDWGIAEGFIPEAERDEFSAEIAETINLLIPEMRQAIMLKALFGQR